MEEKIIMKYGKYQIEKKVSINKESMIESQNGNSEFLLRKNHIQHFTQ